MSYQEPADLHLARHARILAPVEFDAFVKFDQAVFRNDGNIPNKTRHLIALAVAMSTKCPYCIDTHTREAAKAGSSKEEIVEACWVAAAVEAGGAASHALLALRLYDEPRSPE
jgi:AhpD family alkylhydroperoxidase